MAARTKSPTSRRGAAAKKPATRVTSSRAQTTKSKAAKPAAKAAAKPRAAASARGATASRSSRSAAPARKAATAARSTAARATAKKRTTSNRPRGGLAQQVKPDAMLAAIVGAEPTTRADLTKRIWAYIRKNDLQDSENRRQINADEKLKKVFGGKDQVSMFEMTRLVNQHVS